MEEKSTKERILEEALRLFAKNGYLGTSMNDIARQLGVTKAALYKHYTSKQEILDSIVNRMDSLDYERGKKYEMPQGDSETVIRGYREADTDKIKQITKVQFLHWTEEEFSNCFRKMLMLEQYRDETMAALFQKYLVSGPVSYMETIFKGLTGKEADARQLALDFYGPIFLMYSLYDAADEKEEIIKKHILVYDYQAALDVADSLSAEQTVQYRDLIYQAARRVLLDFANVDKTIQKTKFQCLPVRSSSQRKYFEYALTIDIRLKRGEYVDFIRSITPIVVDLFEMILKKQCGIIVDDYCDQYKRAGQWKRMWSAKKLNGTEVGKVLNSHYQKMGKRFEAKDVYSEHLKILTDHFSSDTHLKQLMEDLRNVESNIRNLAAHEIVSVTDETIKNLTDFYGRDIMSKIKELFGYTEISIRKGYWDSYDEMNRKILEQMSNE